MRLIAVVPGAFAILVLVRAGDARAGSCDDEGGARYVRALEAFATKPAGGEPELDHLCFDAFIRDNAALTKRLLAACEKIVARAPDAPTACVASSIELGAKQLGAIDLFEAVGTRFTIEPFEYANLATRLYVKLGDARAVPLMRAAWTSALADKRASQTKHAHNFTVFRHAAIKLFDKHGGPAEVKFLDAQLPAIRDAGLRKAIARARASIDKRAAKP